MFISCGESKKDIESREELSVIIRRINAFYEDYNDNKAREEHLNQLTLRNYFQNYSNQLSDFRQEAAGLTITEKFNLIRTELDFLISGSAKFIGLRQSLLLQMLKMSNTFSDIKRNKELSDEYWDKYLSSNYSSSLNNLYRKQYMEYDNKVDEEREKFRLEIKELSSLVKEYKINNQEICQIIDTINNHAKKSDFINIIIIKKIILNSADYLNETINLVEMFESLNIEEDSIVK